MWNSPQNYENLPLFNIFYKLVIRAVNFCLLFYLYRVFRANKKILILRIMQFEWDYYHRKSQEFAILFIFDARLAFSWIKLTFWHMSDAKKTRNKKFKIKWPISGSGSKQANQTARAIIFACSIKFVFRASCKLFHFWTNTLTEQVSI